MRPLRPIAFALLLIITLDLVLALPAARQAPRDVRISRVSTQGLDELANAMVADDAVSVAVVGDSIIQGLFADPDETAPFYLDRIYQRQNRPVRAYNLGMSAAHGLELLAATDKVVRDGHADIVVLTFNYAFYGGNTTWPRYPWLYDDTSWLGTTSVDPAVVRAVDEAKKKRTLADDADALLGRVWRLYGSRGYYSAALFDGPPGEAVTRAVSEWRDKFAGTYRAPRKLKPNELDGKKLRTMLDVPELSMEHENARLFLESVEHARAGGAHVVVVVTPLNRTGLRYQNALDESRYARNIAWMREQVLARGGDFYEASEGFPDELIADSVHPLPPGYEVLAQRIAEHIDPAVRRAEARIEAKD